MIIATFTAELFTSSARLGAGAADLGASAMITGSELVVDDAMVGTLIRIAAVSLEVSD